MKKQRNNGIKRRRRRRRTTNKIFKRWKVFFFYVSLVRSPARPGRSKYCWICFMCPLPLSDVHTQSLNDRLAYFLLLPLLFLLLFHILCCAVLFCVHILYTDTMCIPFFHLIWFTFTKTICALFFFIFKQRRRIKKIYWSLKSENKMWTEHWERRWERRQKRDQASWWWRMTKRIKRNEVRKEPTKKNWNGE